jgi:hypothetical protein
MRLLIVGNAENGEFERNAAWFEKWADENGIRYVPEFIDSTIMPDTIGAYTDDTGTVYIDAGKFYNVQELTKKQLAHIARSTAQICLLGHNASGYNLYYQNASKKKIGNKAETIKRGYLDLNSLKKMSNATYDLHSLKYWTVAA